MEIDINAVDFWRSLAAEQDKVIVTLQAELAAVPKWTRITKDPASWPPKSNVYILLACSTGVKSWTAFVTWGFTARPDAMMQLAAAGQWWMPITLPESTNE